MTAVEWLVEKLNNKIDYIPIKHWDSLREIIQQALEMEKEQIMQAYKFNATGEPDGAEHYYEIFYKKH
jgi:hypothetical protein